MKYLKTKGYFVKYHGNPFSEAGTPDILGCFGGRFLAFELKTGTKLSKIQELRSEEIYSAGGRYYVVTDLQQVKDAIEEIEKEHDDLLP